MTTRAGFIGFISGIILSAIVHIAMAAWSGAVVQNEYLVNLHWIIQCVIALLLIATGYWAARWNGSKERWRCVALGSLAAIVAVIFLYGLWGAAFAVIQLSAMQTIPITVMIQFTIALFFELLISGSLLGALGGFIYHPSKTLEKDLFNKEEPQMAMNASITAVSASIVAVAITAVTFPKLSGYLGYARGSFGPNLFPLYAALVLAVSSQYALTLVVPHETEQAEHVSGMDEVKMAAFVGIGTAPLLILLLLIINIQLLGDLFVIGLLVCSAGMSLYSIRSLVRLVLPKRNSYPKHSTKEQETLATFFGSIANSKAWRLVTLCIGCGMAMVFPIYIAVLAPLYNINAISNAGAPFGYHSVQAQQLFWTHIKTSMGLNLIVILVLSAMYIFYLNLGKWFRKKQTNK